MLFIRRVRVEAPGTLNRHITDIKYSTTETGPLVTVNRDVVASVIETGHHFRTHNDHTAAQAAVTTRIDSQGHHYLTTVADGEETNNLLELPRFS